MVTENWETQHPQNPRTALHVLTLTDFSSEDKVNITEQISTLHIKPQYTTKCSRVFS